LYVCPATTELGADVKVMAPRAEDTKMAIATTVFLKNMLAVMMSLQKGLVD
jgi:hypothetical protein